MAKIDENYLGHKLKHYIEFYPHYDYKCEKCDIILWYDENIITPDEYNYNLCEGNAIINHKIKRALTCEEFIIKSIIE